MQRPSSWKPQYARVLPDFDTGPFEVVVGADLGHPIHLSSSGVVEDDGWITLVGTGHSNS